MEELQLQHAPDQWRFFIHSPKLSLKAVLQRSGNKLPSIILAHAIHMKETSASIQGLLGKNMLRRPPVEHVCRPESCGIADWAVRRLCKILLLPV
jgi:hypothetical protein